MSPHLYVLHAHRHSYQSPVHPVLTGPVQLSVVRQEGVGTGDGEVGAEGRALAHGQGVEEGLLVPPLCEHEGHQASVSTSRLSLPRSHH